MIVHYCPGTTPLSAIAQSDILWRHLERVRRGPALLKNKGRQGLKRYRVFHVSSSYFDSCRALGVSARFCARNTRDRKKRREFLAMAKLADAT